MAGPPLTSPVGTPPRSLLELFSRGQWLVARRPQPAVGQSSGFRVPQTQVGILALLVTSCVVLVSLAASLSLKFLLCKRDAIILLSQDFAWLK